ncbi:hypothetical protein [Legionella hackeliae]|uniref:Uncharacterized protein n=1 Tax=Legionella hackeliae TaxID=449 RepID=A0A0A8UWP4_LEGHA|nr:hypothetical protein [Legionella hackeliae]KTD15470.1 hypothetical protein Lhac_0312 [Legionella hackeliae]CEK11159.1 protein of unknown function [Legionella hackeliae]STX47922.1 Uncharacterised protein [Legionella hackeliae]
MHIYQFVQRFNQIIDDLNKELQTSPEIIRDILGFRDNLTEIYSKRNAFSQAQYWLLQRINQSFPIELHFTEEQHYFKNQLIEVINTKWQCIIEIIDTLISGDFTNEYIEYYLDVIAEETKTVPYIYQDPGADAQNIRDDQSSLASVNENALDKNQEIDFATPIDTSSVMTKYTLEESERRMKMRHDITGKATPLFFKSTNNEAYSNDPMMCVFKV